MPLARFRIVSAAGEPLSVQFNGSNLPEGLHVTGLSLQLVEGVPQLVLGVSGEAIIEGEGIVVIEREGDEIAYLRKFVESIDPDEWNRKSLEHASGLETSPGEMFKSALLEMIG